MSSWKAEFEVSGSWATNAVRLATKVEGEKYANDLFCRWTQPTGFRVVESTDEVNYAWGPNGLQPRDA